jgi:hypothetical protein
MSDDDDDNNNHHHHHHHNFLAVCLPQDKMDVHKKSQPVNDVQGNQSLF